MQLKRVVVTGLGAVSPIGIGVDNFWDALKNGKSGAAPITRFDATHFKTQFACEVKDFDPLNWMEKKEVRKLDLFTQFAIASSEEAIQDSGLSVETMDADRIGVIWASGIGGITTFQGEATKLDPENPRFSPFFIPKMILDIAAGHISMRNGFRGPNYATVSACASSTHAIIDGFNLIRLGKADALVVGGSEAAVNESGIGGFNALQALSTRNDSPESASRPFDSTRGGFVLGEGGAGLILEEYEHAKARGANIYAEIVGGGMTADAHHITAPHPEGLGAMNVMRLAIEEAGIEPSDVDYINVHGTSTPLGDVAETKAIKSLMGEAAYDLNISSTKSMTGHLLGAAGAIEAVASILAVQHNVVPPTINHEHVDENIDPKLNLTLNQAQERTVNYALSNTFGFGGHNASIIVKKWNE